MRLVGSKRAVRTAEFHRRQVRRRKFDWASYGVLLALLLVSPAVIFRSSKQLINRINISSELDSGTAIRNLVEADLSGSYLGVFPKRSVFLVPKKTIVADVLKAFPNLASAVVSKDGFNGLKLDLVERSPEALYCGGRCYFLDANGFIFSEAPNFTPGVYSVFKVNPILEDPLGKTLLPADELKTLEIFYKNLPRIGLNPLYIELSRRELRVYIVGGAYLVWDRNTSTNKAFSNLETVLNNKVIRLADLPDLEYIDLRFGDKVFYRYKNE